MHDAAPDGAVCDRSLRLSHGSTDRRRGPHDTARRLTGSGRMVCAYVSAYGRRAWLGAVAWASSPCSHTVPIARRQENVASANPMKAGTEHTDRGSKRLHQRAQPKTSRPMSNPSTSSRASAGIFMNSETQDIGNFDTFHPPPNALISSTLASMRRRRMSTSLRSFWRAAV